jgi:tetratricopeptide (TPR) repeat protein
VAEAIKVFISYSHDSPEHMDRVLALSDRLRREGVDCRVDRYEQSPPEGWPQWCENQVEKAEFALVVCTEVFARRFKKEEEPGKGLGVIWEASIITQELYDKQGRNKKFIPIAFCAADFAHIPTPLRGATRYDLSSEAGYEDLYRQLTGQPAVTAPELGAVRVVPPRLVHAPLPPLEQKQDFVTGWTVPYPRNPFFTGREKVLAALHAALQKRGRAALSGLGGVGKTQTATEYAYRHRKDYHSVLWASAESRETLLSSFVSIASALNLPESTAKEQEAAVGAVKRWLETHSGWLLVLDNADDLAIAREFMPHHPQGHILLTTRAQATSAIAERVEIEEMETEEGALFLLRRAGLVPKEQPLSVASAADRSLAEQIWKEVGGLPLALDQAGAFMEETPSSLAEYLTFYKSEGAKLRAERGGLGDHPSVTVTFSLAFNKVAEASAAAADLIRLCAFLAPDAIPEEIFTNSAAELGETATEATTPLAFAQVLKECGRFSLIDRNPQNKTLDIHRLVQSVVRDGMDGAEQRRWAERAVRAVNTAFPHIEFPDWPKCERLLPHAQACAAVVEEFGFEFHEIARLFNQAGLYLGKRARYAEAEPLYQRALAILEKTLGPEHPNVANTLNNLAGLYYDRGKFAEAEPLYLRALAMRERVLGPEHPDVGQSLNNLAGLYSAQGKYAEAEPLYLRALAIRGKALGPEHPDVATTLNNLAGLHCGQGKYADAEPLYQRAVAIDEKALGPEHPETATDLNNLAVLYNSQGKYAEAEPLHRRALAIREKALGPEHPDVANSLNNLAGLYHAQGKYAEAESLYQRALVLLEKTLGPVHPGVASSVNNLALLYCNQGKYAEAEPLYQRALKIDEKALGPDDRNVAQSLNNLAGVYFAQGKYAEAEPLCQRTLAIWEKALGQEHPKVVTTLENYAALLRKTGRPSQAADMDARAEAIRAKQESR